MTDQDLEKLFEPVFEEDEDFAKQIRCDCGQLCTITKPGFCIRCKTPLAYWKDIHGKLHKLADMDIGHLTATVKMLSEKIEQIADYRKKEYEIAIDFFYEEINSRDQEIQQLASIERGLMKVLRASRA